jgi:hypothetical protein
MVGGALYMNPFTAKIYKKYQSHPSMKIWTNQKKYLTGVFLVAGFIPNLFIITTYQFLAPISVMNLSLILFGVRIIPRMCDMWMQTSYPNKILLVELINGAILSFVISFMITTIL